MSWLFLMWLGCAPGESVPATAPEVAPGSTLQEELEKAAEQAVKVAEEIAQVSREVEQMREGGASDPEARRQVLDRLEQLEKVRGQLAREIDDIEDRYESSLVADVEWEGRTPSVLTLPAGQSLPTGHFCELITARVSCFEIKTQDAGFTLTGVAYALMSFARWSALSVDAYDGETRTFRYTYTSQMLRNQRIGRGTSELVFPGEGEAITDGWYEGSDGRRVPFRLRTLDGLEDCLGLDHEGDGSSRYRRVARSAKLGRCGMPLE